MLFANQHAHTQKVILRHLPIFSFNFPIYGICVVILNFLALKTQETVCITKFYDDRV